MPQTYSCSRLFLNELYQVQLFVFVILDLTSLHMLLTSFCLRPFHLRLVESLCASIHFLVVSSADLAELKRVSSIVGI